MKTIFLFAVAFSLLQNSYAQQNTDLRLLVGLSVNGFQNSDEVTIGQSVSVGALKNDGGFLFSVGFAKRNNFPAVQYATFSLQPMVLLTEDFYFGLGPQIKLDGPNGADATLCGGFVLMFNRSVGLIFNISKFENISLGGVFGF